MPKAKNPLLSLINNQGPLEESALSELATYLTSNKTYKYTPTYLCDSEDEYIRFKINLSEFKTKVLTLYTQLRTEIEKLSLTVFSTYEIKINKAVSVSSDEPEQLKLIEIDGHQLLAFLNQRDFFKHYLTFKFSYNKDIQLFEIQLIEYLNSIEHTFEIRKETDIESAIAFFINLLKLTLCEK